MPDKGKSKGGEKKSKDGSASKAPNGKNQKKVKK